MKKEQVYTIFMLVRTTSSWLTLDPKSRFKFLDNVIRPILKKHPEVNLRFFDAEAFSSNFSDVMMWETAHLPKYQSLVEGLRESNFWGTYFEIREIVPSIENAYATHYNVDPI